MKEILKRLHLTDLCTAANVCTRLKELAGQLFEMAYKDSFFNVFDLQRDLPSVVTQSQIDKFLSVFGAFITKASVVENKADITGTIILKLIAEHCANLNELRIEAPMVQPTALMPIKTFLSQLKTLYVYVESLDADLFTDGCQIERLEVDYGNPLDLRIMKLPKMIELHLYRLLVLDDTIKAFFANNPQIRHFSAFNCFFEPNSLEILPKHMPNIQEIRFEYCSYECDDMQSWLQLNSLKKLTIVDSAIPIGPLLDGCASIEHLEMQEMTVPGNFINHSLSLMKRLSILHIEKLTPDINDHHLLCLLKNLSELTELLVTSKNITIDGIKTVLQNTKTPAKFHIKLDNDELIERSATEIFQVIGHHGNIRISDRTRSVQVSNTEKGGM